jgi:hypothetical protein
MSFANAFHRMVPVCHAVGTEFERLEASIQGLRIFPNFPLKQLWSI